MFCVKTGMKPEIAVVRRTIAPDGLLLSGNLTADDLDKAVPQTCKGIISVGLCGGLVPGLQIGDTFVCRRLYTPDGPYEANVAWMFRLQVAYQFMTAVYWWSDGRFNTANTLEQRGALAKTGAMVIDDETYHVVRFALRRGIPWQALRVMSDGVGDDLPPAVIDALDPDGGINVWNVVSSVIKDPTQLPIVIDLARKFKIALTALDTACNAVGPRFQAPGG